MHLAAAPPPKLSTITVCLYDSLTSAPSKNGQNYALFLNR